MIFLNNSLILLFREPIVCYMFISLVMECRLQRQLQLYLYSHTFGNVTFKSIYLKLDIWFFFLSLAIYKHLATPRVEESGNLSFIFDHPIVSKALKYIHQSDKELLCVSRAIADCSMENMNLDMTIYGMLLDISTSPKKKKTTSFQF